MRQKDGRPEDGPLDGPTAPERARLGMAELKEVLREFAEDQELLAETLVDVALNGRTEEVRVQAGIAVLSRVGLARGVKVTDAKLLASASATSGSASTRRPGEVVHERLAALRPAEAAPAPPGGP